MEELTQQAVHAALEKNWDEALRINKLILKESSDNVDCLLRLAHAYLSQGNISKAKASLNKALKLSPDNHLAQRILTKCKNPSQLKVRPEAGKINLKAFMETPGKTKLIKLLHLGSPSIISSIQPGESVKILISKSKVTIESSEGVHIGRFPDDVAAKVWTNKTSKFEAFIKSSEPSNVVVLLQEKSIN